MFSPCAGIQNYNIISLAERYSASLTLQGVCYCIPDQNYFCHWSSHFELFPSYFSRWSLRCELFCHCTVIQHYFCCRSLPAPSCYFVEFFSRLIATLRAVLSPLLRFKINFHHMVENCFVEVKYSNWFLSLITLREPPARTTQMYRLLISRAFLHTRASCYTGIPTLLMSLKTQVKLKQIPQ